MLNLCKITTTYTVTSVDSEPHAGGPGQRLFIGCFEGSPTVESAAFLAKEIHKAVCSALGLNESTDADDVSLPLGKVANMTTDTASVMSATAKLLSERYRLFKDMAWTPCSCHVLNLFLTDQEKAFKTIRAVIATGKLIVALFRNSAPRKLFQRCDRATIVHCFADSLLYRNEHATRHYQHRGSNAGLYSQPHLL